MTTKTDDERKKKKEKLNTWSRVNETKRNISGRLEILLLLFEKSRNRVTA